MARITNAEQARIITELSHDNAGLRAEVSLLRTQVTSLHAQLEDEAASEAPSGRAVPSSKTYPTFTEASAALKRLAMSPINRVFKFKLTGTTVSATPR